MTSHSEVRHRAPLMLLMVVLMSCAAMSGCNIVGPIFFFVAGPPKYDAEFVLPKDRATVIFIDDPRSQIPRRALRVTMVEAAEKQFLEKGLVEDLVGGQSALHVAQSDRSGGQLSVAEIGRAVDAEVVVWVTVDSFVRADVSTNNEPSISFRVRVVDAADNQVLWPSSPEGRSMTVRLSSRIGSVANDAGAQSTMELKMAKNAGLALSQLFYKHLTTAHAAEDRSI